MRKLILALSVALALGACGRDKPATTAPAPAAPTPTTTAPVGPSDAFFWKAVAPSTQGGADAAADLTLSHGSVMAVFAHSPVTANQAVSAQFDVSSATAHSVRAVLMRHCGNGSEMDADSEVFTVTATPTTQKMHYTFTAAHPCVRIMFTSPDGSAEQVKIANLWLARQ